jgi:hypothetical protein
LIRAAVAIAHQLGLQSLFALCAPYTIKPVACCGMELEPSIGKAGTFYYPKLDLLATTMLLKDLGTLSKAQEEDKEAIFRIRQHPDIVRTEMLRNRNITIHYETAIPNLDRWDLSEVIANTQKNKVRSGFSENDLEFF